MGEVKVETEVDDLISLLESRGKLGIQEAASELGIGEKFVQSWVDFLVEEKILGIEYKFTKPFIFLNKKNSFEDSNSKIMSKKDSGLSLIKKAYLDHAKEKNISEDKALILWNKKLRLALEKRKDFFIFEANKRKLKDVEGLFASYGEKLLAI